MDAALRLGRVTLLGTGPAALLVAGLLVAPVAAGLLGVLLPAFGYLPALGGNALTLRHFEALLAQPALARSLVLSLVVGLATTLLSLGAAALFLAAFSGGRTFALVRGALAPVLAVPHAAAAFGLAFLIAPSGLAFRLAAQPLGLERPPDLLIVGDPMGFALMAGLFVKELPFLLLVAFAALPQADPERRTALARSLGYGRTAGFLFTVWPAVYRQIRLPVLAVLAYGTSVVDVSLILGPSLPPTFSVRLLRWMADPDLSMRFLASAGAVLQLALTFAAILIWLGLERAGGLVLAALRERGLRGASDKAVRLLAGLAAGLPLGAVLSGLGILFLWSFAGLWPFPDLAPATFSPTVWTRALGSAAGPLSTTAIVALSAALLALLLVGTLLESHRRAARAEPAALPAFIAALIYLPLIVPQIAFLFGLQILVLVAGLTPSLPLLIAGHLVFVGPYVALALAAPWFALDPRYERLALSLRASRATILLAIRVPLLLPAIAAAFAIGFATSVGQYLPTVILGAGRLPTITTEAVALASGGNPRLVGAYALMQTALPALVFALAALVPFLVRLRRAGGGVSP